MFHLQKLNESISVRQVSNIRTKSEQKIGKNMAFFWNPTRDTKFSFRCHAYRGTRCYVTVDRMRIMWAASFIRKVNNYTFPFVSQVGRQVYEVDGN